jgi:TolB-like protein
MRRTSLDRLTLALLSTLIVLSAPAGAAASKVPRLGVLYFDNNTADKKLDVLQKGLADMFITDLASVRGIVVVERDKLQSILKELKLQRSRYFNKRTAVRIGKQLGATHVVSGNFAIAGDKIRIGARLIQVRTGRVLVGKKVVGAKTAIFELEQKLVALFVTGLRQATAAGGAPARSIRTYRPRRRGRTNVPNVAMLVDYSKGLDLTDKGKLRAAALRLAAVAARAPTFRLAKQRERELQRRVKLAGQRRASQMSAQARALWTKARTYVKQHKVGKNKEVAKLILGYRDLIGQLQLRALRKHLPPKRPHLVVAGKRGAVLAAIKRYLKNQLALLKDIARYAKRHTRVMANGVRYLDTFVRFPAADQQVLREAKLRTHGSARPASVSVKLARFLLMGSAFDSNRAVGTLALAPPPAILSARYLKLGESLLATVIKDQDKQAKRKVPMAEHFAIEARVVWGRALLMYGKRDAAVTKWQEVLDTYPTSRRYKNVERLVKAQLGLSRSNTMRELKRYQKGLKGCKDMDLRVGLRGTFYRRMRLMGMAGLTQTIKEIEKACRAKHQSGQARLKRFWKYLYQNAALKAGRAGQCKAFDRWIKRAVSEGLSPRSASGYRKNYTSCP